MLTLTQGATEAIQGLVTNRPGAGLRIFSESTEGDQAQLALSISDAPEPSDDVIEQAGCQVFVDAQVSPMLSDRTLDAQLTGDQKVQFSFLK